MRRLSGPDAAFVYGERPEWQFHVTGLIVLAPDEEHPFSFDRLRETLVRRIHRAPEFRQKLLDKTLGWDHPVMVDDPQFDIDHHLRRIGVTPPGDDRALGDLVGRLTSYRLDRRYPLWEMWVIEGLENGRVAVLSKIHHSIIDGVTGMDLAQVIMDTEANPPDDPPAPPFIPESPPSDAQLVAHSAAGVATLPLRVGVLGLQTVAKGVAMIKAMRSPEPPAQPFSAPRTPFNGRLTPRRQVAWSYVSLADAKTVKDALGVKVNDVVLAVTGGALRSYLESLGALPDRPLVAQVPVSLRTESNRKVVGTQVGAMFATLATDEPDPVKRLRTVAARMRSAKVMREDMTAVHSVNITDATPPGLLGLAARMWTRAGLDARTPPIFNLIVSNTVGAPFQLYQAGAPVEAMYPLGPLLYGSGVNVSVISNFERIDFGLLACPDLLPDVWDLAEWIPLAMGELLAAAEAAPGAG